MEETNDKKKSYSGKLQLKKTFNAGQTTTVDGTLSLSGSGSVKVSSDGTIRIVASGIAAISGSSVLNNGIAQLGPGVT